MNGPTQLLKSTMKLTCLSLVALLVGAVGSVFAAPLGSTFSYQGRLTDDGAPATGNYDLQFTLFGAPSGGVALAGPQTVEDTPVTNGLFTVSLDFGATAFNGDARWLEIGVRPGANTGLFTTLSPRQPLFPAPYALFAPTAAAVPSGAITSNMLANGAVTSSKLATGSVTSVQLADSIALGATNFNGRLDLYRTVANTPGISLVGGSQLISLFGFDGLEKTHISGAGHGEFWLNNNFPPGNRTTVYLSANGLNDGGGFGSFGYLSLGNSNAQQRALMTGGNGGGLVRLFSTTGTNTIALFGGGSQISTYGSDGREQVRLWGPTWGEVLLFDNINNDNTVQLSSGGVLLGDSGGFLALNSSNGAARVNLQGSPAGGALQLNDAKTQAGARLDGGAGALTLAQPNGINGVKLDAHNSQINTFGADGSERVRLWGSVYGEVLLFNGQPGNATAARLSAEGGAGGTLTLNAANGSARAFLSGNNSFGYLSLSRSDGTSPVFITADDGTGHGRVTTQVLQITGGSDLSEQFEVKPRDAAVEPGMVVCIDPEHPGRLAVSHQAYDRTAAGVVSGAGGVNPGLLMGQHDSVADGHYPVALSGRVYCRVDSGNGAIQPGDLLTTSNVPGHAMRVTDPARAQGAIIGKAMSGLAEGRGLVLVLVSLQ